MNPIQKTILSFDWITLALVLSLLSLTLAKYISQNKFLTFIILPFNHKYIVLSNKKGRLFNWFHILTTLFQCINLSLFVVLIKRTWDTSKIENESQVFLFIVAFTILFIAFKILLQLFKSYVFNTQKLVLDLIFRKITYFNYSSLIMFISNVILVYMLDGSKTVIYISVVLILSINAIGLAKLIKNHQNIISHYIFYFILYLCTLEIAPLVVIGSYLKG